MSEVNVTDGVLAVNFDEVPDTVPPLNPGIKRLRNLSASVEPTKDGTGKNLKVVHEVIGDLGPSGVVPTSDSKRQITNYLYISNDPRSLSRIKNLFQSSGVTTGSSGGVISDLVGKECTAVIENKPYTNKTTGRTRETSNIAEYLVESQAPASGPAHQPV